MKYTITLQWDFPEEKLLAQTLDNVTDTTVYTKKRSHFFLLHDTRLTSKGSPELIQKKADSSITQVCNQNP